MQGSVKTFSNLTRKGILKVNVSSAKNFMEKNVIPAVQKGQYKRFSYFEVLKCPTNGLVKTVSA